MNPTNGLRCINLAQFFLFFAVALEISLIFISSDGWTTANIIIAIFVAIFSILSALLEVAGVWKLHKINMNFAGARFVVVLYLLMAIAIVVLEAFKYNLEGWIIAVYIMHCFRLIARLLIVICIIGGTNKIVNIQNPTLVQNGVKLKGCFIITTAMIVICYFYASFVVAYNLYGNDAELIGKTVYIALTIGMVIKLAIHTLYLTYTNGAYKVFKDQ